MSHPDRIWTIHGQDTLPRLFRHVVKERGDAVAMREKLLGIWRAITWREYGERARHVGLGLVALGLQPRDVVSVISDNCPEWLYTDLGTMSVGGVTNGIYTTDSPRQVEYILNDSGTRFFFAENEEQLDKILEVRARCPQLVKIFVYDMEGLHDFRFDAREVDRNLHRRVGLEDVDRGSALARQSIEAVAATDLREDLADLIHKLAERFRRQDDSLHTGSHIRMIAQNKAGPSGRPVPN